MLDRETITNRGDGGASAILTGALVIAVIVGGVFLYVGTNDTPSPVIDVSATTASVGAAPSGH